MTDRVRLTISIPKPVHNMVSDTAHELGISKNAVITLLLTAAIHNKDLLHKTLFSNTTNDFTDSK
jgi:hypothetical protein